MPVKCFSLWLGPSMFALLLALACAARADDWPQWRGPNRNGISRETGWQAQWSSPPTKLWQAGVGVGYSSEAVANGRLYTMGNVDETDYVYCLDANSGK